VFLASLAVAIARDPGPLAEAHLIFWILVLVGVELLPVQVSGTLQLSLGFPILLGVSILYPPVACATIAFLGSVDPLEVRREIALKKSLFNRSQIAMATAAGSAAFHALGSVDSPLFWLVPIALCAVAAHYVVNIAFVSMAMRLIHGIPIVQGLRRLKLGGFSEFLFNYIGLGSVGIIIARLYTIENVGILAVAAFILPLIFARQMFFRNLALERAHKELKDRGEVLRALSNRMAEERQDERMRIAAYLHDDLAQMLFRLNLQAEMAKKRLTQGDVDAVSRDIEGILSTKQETSNAIRALIRDLHRSPIGRKGLAEALQSFAEDMSKGPTRVVTDVVEVSLPPPIQLLIYQISREATMNALKHAEAEEIAIVLSQLDDGVVLAIRDDGKGFDINQPQPEGHFGSVMMRERALVAGGTYTLDSEPGKGTSITVTFPRVWVEEGSQLEATEGDGAERALRPPIGTTTGPQATIPLPEGISAGRVTTQGETELEQEEPEEVRSVPV
jgi:signal transduction histidine kinase